MPILVLNAWRLIKLLQYKTFENTHPLTGQIYTGKSNVCREKNVDERVVKELVAPYKGSARNVTIDNYFYTLPLAKSLLSWDLTTVGTLKKNKTYIPPDLLNQQHLNLLGYALFVSPAIFKNVAKLENHVRYVSFLIVMSILFQPGHVRNV